MTVSFGSRAPSQKAVSALYDMHGATPKSGVIPLHDQSPDGPLVAIRLDSGIAHEWPARDQYGRGTCVAFATLAAIELVKASRDDMHPERLSEDHFHQTMVQKHPLGAEGADAVPEGGVLLNQAWHALVKDGVVGADNAPYKPPRPRSAGQAGTRGRAQARAQGQRHTPLAYGTIAEAQGIEAAKVDQIQPGTQTAAKILAFLAVGQPVVAGVPLFAHPSGLSNWTLPAAIRSGLVLCPADAGAPSLAGPRSDGHVVCITGFLPDVTEPLGGWFVFRNSWGLEFASRATIPTDALTSGTRGYGLLSATHINAYCWEYLVPGAPHTG